MASLFVIQGADQGKRFEFKSSPVALGRDNSNAIRLHDTEVSRRHAELRQDEEAYRIVDLGSANGTFVNGQPIDQAPLHSGDRLQLGQTVMLFNEGTAEPQARPDGAGRPAEQEQPRRPLGDPQEHSLGRGLAGPAEARRRRRAGSASG